MGVMPSLTESETVCNGVRTTVLYSIERYASGSELPLLFVLRPPLRLLLPIGSRGKEWEEYE